MQSANLTSEKENAFVDSPICKSSEDLLGRERFAKEFSSVIRNWQLKESLVLGLYGKWGEGKTSTKNLIIENLKNERANKVEVFEFNPWEWSSSKELTKNFLEEFSKLISKDSTEESEKFCKSLQKYGVLLRPVIDIYQPGAGTLIKVCLQYFRKQDKNSKSLLEIKEKIKASMIKRNSKILVVVDDIDRLQVQEIRDVFRFIKSNFNFPNIIFLTLFQRDIVEKALSQDNFSGEKYLEKIIQVSINLPEISKTTLENILIKKLRDLLKKYYQDGELDEDRWYKIYPNSLMFYFNNLRDIKRFIHLLEFQMNVLKINDLMEVNFIDIIGIEIFRQFEPEIYQRIFKNKEILTYESSDNFNDHSLNKNKKEIIRGIIEIQDKSTEKITYPRIQPSTKREESILDIFKTMFPNTEDVINNTGYRVSNEDFIKKRICHKDRFDRYFLFFIEEEEFYQYELESMLNATSNEKKLLGIFLKYKEENRLDAFLQKLEYYKQSIPAENAIPFLSVMFYLGDIVDDDIRGFLEYPPFQYLRRIIFWYLKKEEFQKNSKEILLNAIDKTHGIFMPIEILWEEHERREEEKYPDSYRLKPEDKSMIKNKILELIKDKKDRFQENIYLSKIINIWQQLDKSSATKWLSSFIEKDEHFIKFLNMLIFKRIGYIHSSKQEKFYFDRKWTNNFFDDITGMIKRFKKLKDSNKIDIKKYPNVIEAMELLDNQHNKNLKE